MHVTRITFTFYLVCFYLDTLSMLSSRVTPVNKTRRMLFYNEGGVFVFADNKAEAWVIYPELLPTL